MWSTHPRVVRCSTDVELLTFDLRMQMQTTDDKYHLKCAQRHLYYDTVTAVNSYENYISVVYVFVCFLIFVRYCLYLQRIARVGSV